MDAAISSNAGMTPDDSRSNSWLPLVAAVLFAVAHTQPIGFYSNQNQYLLHGLAEAGYGDLGKDWLATTRDPTPVFSAGVASGYRLAGVVPLHVEFFAVLLLYFLSLWELASRLPRFPGTLGGQAVVAAGLVVIHAAIARAGSVWLVGTDYPWYFQAGVANQYLLGPGLQPSVFGVLLVTSLAAFSRGRSVAAGLLAAGACWFHSTYLLPAGLLVAGMLVSLALQGRMREAVRTGGFALLGVVPVIAYVLVQFAPSSPANFAEAQAIIAWQRIPHHADVNRWLDVVAGLQLAWIGLGILLLRGTPLFPVLAVAATVATLLAGLQLATGNATLALLFPWRISAVLVPVATTVVLVRFASFAQSRFPGSLLFAGSSLLGIAAAVGAWPVYSQHLGYQQTAAEETLIRDIAQTRQPGNVYLLPTEFPRPSTSRGTGSMTFVPVKSSDRPAIFELQRFRLGSGGACYIDYKSIPYRDAEVLEWHRRVTQAARWYGTADWDASGIVGEIVAEGITHVVLPAGSPVHSRRLMQVVDGPAYRVYRIAP